ncbi:hypothetical protein [Deinococcus sp. 12RED42]|nr:hypothetical protein [Deinococcus sp. 12RED42]
MRTSTLPGFQFAALDALAPVVLDLTDQGVRLKSSCRPRRARP